MLGTWVTVLQRKNNSISWAESKKRSSDDVLYGRRHCFKDQDEMREHLGQNQSSGISEEEFEIEILHWLIPNLNFVDLPGVVSGIRSNEPASLPDQTEVLTKRYISDKNSLILAVIPCMEYIVNNKIVGLIQECDAVDRTLCVLTKIDITKPSSTITERVLGLSPDSEPFRNSHGYIGVSNGSNNSNTDMTEITRIETNFCTELARNHPNQPRLEEKLGLRSLVARLSRSFERPCCPESSW